MWNDLAQKLREMTPSGLKDERYSWRGSLSEIKNRLITFTKKWKDANTLYTTEDVIKAYQRYLDDSSNPDGTPHKWRKILKYFIWKEGRDGEDTSLLIKYLEEPEETSAEIRAMCNNVFSVDNAGNQSTSWIDKLL